MIKNSALLILLLLPMLVFQSAWAAKNVMATLPNRDLIPQEFWFHGNPIDPYDVDFNGDSSRFDPRPLNADPFLTGEDIVFKTDRRQYYEKQGFYGYHYEDKNSPGFNPAYEYYKYIGQWHGMHILWTEESGGGSGQFHELVGVARNGNTIQLKKEFAGGDRYYHYIDYAKIDNGSLCYGLKLFADEFITYFLDDLHKEAFEKLAEFSAIDSGFTEANYCDEKLVSVDILPMDQPLTQNYNKKGLSRSPVQPCLDQFLWDEAKGQKESLTMDQYKDLTDRFFKQCVKGP